MGWSRGEHLLAAVVDVLREANWQRSAQNSKRRPRRPKPVSPTANAGQRTGRTDMSPAQVVQTLAANRTPKGGE